MKKSLHLKTIDSFLEEAKFPLTPLFQSLLSILLQSFPIQLCCESESGQIFCTNISKVVEEHAG